MPAANAAAPVKKNSNFQAIVKRLFQNRGAVIGLIIFIVLALAAIFAPVAAPYGYEEMDLTNMLSGPSLEHLFGTDELGRDVFSRIIYGGRYSLSIGLAATAFGAVVGCAIGAITGYFGGTLDTVLMRFLDILVDGPFVLAQRNLDLLFRGSENQRILDVPKSLAAGRAVWCTAPRWVGERQG